MGVVDNLIKQLRFLSFKMDLHQKDLATLFEVSQPTISHWFDGKYFPRGKKILLIEKFINENKEKIEAN